MVGGALGHAIDGGSWSALRVKRWHSPTTDRYALQLEV
jgi:hypothetical protein